MNINIYIPCIAACFMICSMVLDSQCAAVSTKSGTHDGRVIARMFDQIVVTVITPNQRIFQFAAADVEMISATEPVLVNVHTFLRDEPSNTAEPSTALTRGQEVTILDAPKDSDWVKVQVWGKHQGWMIRELLSTKVVFTPEEKNGNGSMNKTIRTGVSTPHKQEH